MIYNIDGTEIEIDMGNEKQMKPFNKGYYDGMYHQNVRNEFDDLGEVHDKYSKNPHEKDSMDYKIYKAGFIQCIS